MLIDVSGQVRKERNKKTKTGRGVGEGGRGREGGKEGGGGKWTPTNRHTDK
jgi:hypothetical protein